MITKEKYLEILHSQLPIAINSKLTEVEILDESLAQNYNQCVDLVCNLPPTDKFETEQQVIYWINETAKELSTQIPNLSPTTGKKYTFRRYKVQKTKYVWNDVALIGFLQLFYFDPDAQIEIFGKVRGWKKKEQQQ